MEGGRHPEEHHSPGEEEDTDQEGIDLEEEEGIGLEEDNDVEEEEGNDLEEEEDIWEL